MTATPGRNRRPRVRAPQPTPIRTAKGFRSAAVDDRVLAEFLESSLKVPDLTLPPHLPSSHSPPPITGDIDIRSLVEGDLIAESRVLRSARETGAFRIRGDSVLSIEEVRSAIVAASSVFGVAEERKRELGTWFRRRDIVEEEFYWYVPVSSETDRILAEIFPDSSSYRIFRKNMDEIANKMEKIAESITKTLTNNNVTFTNRIHSVLCITQYNVYRFNPKWTEFGTADSPGSYAICLHVSGSDQEFCLRSVDGSNFFKTRPGSVLVTIGKQLQEISSGEFKTTTGEIPYELTDDPIPFYSLEFFYSIEDLNLSGLHKTVSIQDQILVLMLALTLLYLLWIWI